MAGTDPGVPHVVLPALTVRQREFVPELYCPIMTREAGARRT